MTLESHLNDELKEELAEFINEQEWANDNLYDETDLYEAGLEEMKSVTPSNQYYNEHS